MSDWGGCVEHVSVPCCFNLISWTIGLPAHLPTFVPLEMPHEESLIKLLLNPGQPLGEEEERGKGSRAPEWGFLGPSNEIV